MSALLLLQGQATVELNIYAKRLIQQVNCMSNLKPEQIIETARKYLGAKHTTQGRDPSNMDCGGFVVLVLRDLGIKVEDITGYANVPDGETFERLINKGCKEIKNKSVKVGDLVAMDYGIGKEKGMINHIAIVTQLEPYMKIIHCLKPYGVVEHRLMFGTLHYNAWIKSYRIK